MSPASPGVLAGAKVRIDGTGWEVHISHVEVIAGSVEIRGFAAPSSDVEDAVSMLDRIPTGDPEGAHGAADDVLLAVVPPEVSAAYRRVSKRQSWWAAG